MIYLRTTLCALTLTLVLSSSALAGNIGGLQISSTGNIGGMRTNVTGNIAGLRTSTSTVIQQNNNSDQTLDLEYTMGAMIRVLFTSIALF